jgi:hypothetical protein
MQNCYRSFALSGWARVLRSAATPPPKLRGISPHAPPQNRQITASCTAASGHNSRMVGPLQPPRRAAADAYQIHGHPVLLSASTPHDLPFRASCQPQACARATRSPPPCARSSCSMRLCGEVACWFAARLRVPLTDTRARKEKMDGASIIFITLSVLSSRPHAEILRAPSLLLLSARLSKLYRRARTSKPLHAQARAIERLLRRGAIG